MKSLLSSLLLLCSLLVISQAYNPQLVPVRFVHAVLDGPKADVWANGKLVFSEVEPGTVTDYRVVFFGENEGPHSQYRILLVTIAGTMQLYTGAKPIEVTTDGVYGDKSGYAGIYGSYKTGELIGLYVENQRASGGFRAFYFSPMRNNAIRFAVGSPEGLNYHAILNPLSSSGYNQIASNMSVTIMDMNFNILDIVDMELDIKIKYTMYIIEDFTAATPTFSTVLVEDIIHGWVPPPQVPNTPTQEPTTDPTTPSSAANNTTTFTIPFMYIYVFAGLCGVVLLLAVGVWAQKYRNHLAAISFSQTKGDDTKQMMEKMIFSVSKYDDESPAV